MNYRGKQMLKGGKHKQEKKERVKGRQIKK